MKKGTLTQEMEKFYSSVPGLIRGSFGGTNFWGHDGSATPTIICSAMVFKDLESAQKAIELFKKKPWASKVTLQYTKRTKKLPGSGKEIPSEAVHSNELRFKWNTFGRA